MKNQYFGDIGDYGKYSLLRAFSSERILVGINWYLTEDDGSGDLFYAINYIPVPQPQGNTLQAEVSFEALYAVDENGVIETSAIPYAVAGDNYLVFGHLETRSWLDYSVENEVQKVLLLCAKKEGSNELEIRSFHAINDDDDLSELNLGRQDFEPDPAIWRYIQFAGFPQAVQRDDEGSMLPYDQWPVEDHMLTISLEGIDPDGNRIPFIEWASAEEYPQGMHHDTEVDNSRPWTLRFCPQRTGGKDLVAQFDVMDTQGDHWGSELIPLQKPDVCAVVSVDCAPRDFYGVTVQPYEIKVIRNDAFQGLCLRVQVENHTEDSVMLNILYPLVNGISRNKPDGDNLSVFTGNRYILPGTSGIADYYFDASCLPWREDPIVRTISFVPNHDADMQPFDRLLKDLDRITVETELDVSMLPLPEKPKEPLASDTTPDGLVMELLDLQAGEEGSPSLLSGTVRMLNPTEKIVWIFFAAGKDDSLETAYLNKNFLQNCLRIADYDFLLPGGEGVYDFDVVPDSDGVLWISPNLRLPGADSPPPEQVLDRVEEIGFAHETVAADRQEGEATPFYVHELFLPEPLPLSAPCRILVE